MGGQHQMDYLNDTYIGEPETTTFAGSRNVSQSCDALSTEGLATEYACPFRSMPTYRHGSPKQCQQGQDILSSRCQVRRQQSPVSHAVTPFDRKMTASEFTSAQICTRLAFSDAAAGLFESAKLPESRKRQGARIYGNPNGSFPK